MTRVKRGSQVAGPPPMLGLEEHGGGWHGARNGSCRRNEARKYVDGNGKMKLQLWGKS